jgi:amino acid transporter
MSFVAPTNPPRRLRKDVRLVGLLFTSVGSIIGSGWLFGAQSAAIMAGPSALLSWIIGAALILIIAMVYAELGTLFPVSGGIVRFPHIAFGAASSYGFAWVLWITCCSAAAIEVLAAIQYASAYIDGLMVTKDNVPVLTFPLGFIVAAVLLAGLAWVNSLGVRYFARVNNVLVWVKIAVIVITIVAIGSVSFHPGNFVRDTATDTGGFMPFGVDGVMSAVAAAGIMFAYFGFREAIELAGETDRPQRNIPIAVIGSVIITAILYTALQFVFIGALPAEALADGWNRLYVSASGHEQFGPLAGLATVIGIHWLATLLYVDAAISPFDSGFIYLNVTSRVTYAMAKNGYAPVRLSHLNTRGVPAFGLAIGYLAAAVFFLPFPGWQKMVGFVTAATVVGLASGAVSLGAIRRKLDDRPRSFRLPGGHTLPLLAFIASDLIVCWSGWGSYWKLLVLIAIGYLLWMTRLYWARTRFANPSTASPTITISARSAVWIPVWLSGLLLLTYLGTFPDPSAGEGNIGALSFWWSAAVNIVFSVGIYWWAIRSCLSRDEMETTIDTGFVDEEAAALETATADSGEPHFRTV